MRATGQPLAATRQRFERWRSRHGGRGSRIPETLWREAVRVALVNGVYSTARALRLNYESLKGRCGGAEAARKPAGRASGFVELPTVALGGGQTLVELVGCSGEMMRIHLVGASAAELVGLAQAFWGRP